MPYFSYRILVSPSPFVNLDLFKKGYYHVSIRLLDQKAEQNFSRVRCLEIKDILGPQLNQFTYPGASLIGDRFITQTSLVEYTEQSYLLGECFLFRLDCPIKGDHTDAYLPSSLSLHMELMFSSDEELPKDPSCFTCVSSRSLDFTVDWRKGLHDYFPVVFDYFHMAAIGITVHTSLIEVCLDDFNFDPSTGLSSHRRSIRGSMNGRRWSTFQSLPTPKFPSLQSILFGIECSPDTTPPSSPGNQFPMHSFSTSSEMSSGSRAALYLVPESKIGRAKDAHQMLCDVLRSARDSLCISHAIMSQEMLEVTPSPDVGDLSEANSLEEVERLCYNQLSQLNANLAAAWDWFCMSAVTQPDMTTFIVTRAHQLNMEYSKKTLVSHESPFVKDITIFADPSSQSLIAAKVRKTLTIPMPLYCKENVETSLTSSVVFVEPTPWSPLEEGLSHPEIGEASPLNQIPGTAPGLEGFTRYVHPYLPGFHSPGSRIQRSPGIHLVVCVHGLQGNQFDLRLYRIFLTMALPQVRFDFLMASSNQHDTFCDFNLMTDRLLKEVLEYVSQMPTAPSKISFIGHSLGSIIVRSLVTRPEFAGLHSKLHLYVSICGPHLGTKYQNGIVSVGMWAVRKWYNSKSLLQLSLKDAANPEDSFLYHLSESPSLECFRHIVLIASPQDKYVPYHSAKIATLSQDAAFQTSISLRIMQNILEPLRKARVNLVRLSVDHSIPTSANSVIGRAAHIAMLDSDLFIQKLVNLHLAQYFIES